MFYFQIKAAESIILLLKATNCNYKCDAINYNMGVIDGVSFHGYLDMQQLTIFIG